MITIILATAGTILLGVSLYLESKTSYRGSSEYNKLKFMGGTGACMTWIGIIILGLIK